MTQRKRELTKTLISPRCPFCGEKQGYDEARPSKPRIVGDTGSRHTEWNTECRACGQRIIWSMQFGNGSLEELAIGNARYSWSKP